MKTVKHNYTTLVDFLNDIRHDSSFDNTITCIAFGYLNKRELFSFYFKLILLIYVFDRIENLNGALQKGDFNFNEPHASVEIP